MKNILIILVALLLSCNNHKELGKKNKSIEKKEANAEIDTLKSIQKDFEIDELIGFRLIGMEKIESNRETDPYKKYVIDFTAACYSNELCVFELNKEFLQIKNYYDKKIFQKVKIEDYNIKGKILILNFKDDYIKSIKIVKPLNDIPIYEIEIEGTIIDGISISKYLAKEKDISKFGGIDCGDFDG
ncbi:hypothetical protein ACWGOQ_0019465 [Aquimarina sp. M1]